VPPAAPAVFTLKAVAFDLAEESRSDTVGRVDDLEDYFQRLLNWEGQPATALVAAWEDKFVQEIKENFRSAFERAAFRGKILKVEEDISNQAVGNRVAEFFTAAISPHLSAYRVEACSGPGYPDKKLIRREGERVFVLELKATSEFDAKDSNRIVLTSSSRKLRRDVRAPVNHLLATICYQKDGVEIVLEHLRLDFLEPTTPVDMRLEGSVSRKALARAAHQNATF